MSSRQVRRSMLVISFTPESAGYYLFLTDDNSIGTNKDYSNKKQTGTSPIFAVVGGTGVTVTEKTGIPTVTKKVKDDKLRSDWADKGDSQMDQPVYYQLTGTVAATSIRSTPTTMSSTTSSPLV